MRVDAAADGDRFGDLDALSRFKGYLGAVRRRWYLILLPVVVGAALGWVSTPSNTPAAAILQSTTYYRATHVLIDETQGVGLDGQTQPVNLSQAAYLVNTGEVPSKVATELGVPADSVTSSVIGLPRTQVSSVEVQAIGTDRAKVVALADTSANQLLATMLAQAQADADVQTSRILDQLDKLTTDLARVNDQVALGQASPQLEAQQRSLGNQYSLAYEQFAQLANRPAPSAGLTSLEGAKPVEISKGAFDEAKDTIRNGADYVTGATPTSDPTGGSGSRAPGAGATATTRAGIGGLVGLAFGMGLVLLLDRFDLRLRRRSDVEAATGLTVLAEIPPLSRHQQRTMEVVAHTQHRSRAAEAYRVVRGSVLFSLANVDSGRSGEDGQANVIMVTSGNPAEGKTTTVANLAAVLAEGGFSVLVINCDFRRPQVHKYLLASANEGNDGPVEAPGSTRIGPMMITDTDIPEVKLITGVGEEDPNANPLDVVAMQRSIIQDTRSRFDVILLDTAPFLTTNDASELLSETDQVLLVVRSGRTRVEATQRTMEVLGRFDAPVIGVVMNDSNDAPAAEYYYAYAKPKPSRRRRSTDEAMEADETNGVRRPSTNGDGQASESSVRTR